jgi:hypothetical protein
MGTRNNKAPPIQKDPLLKHRAEEVRKQIQATKLIQRWQAMALGELTGDPATLGVQERAIKGLLAKVLPDRSALEMTGDNGGPLTITINKIT